MTSGPRRDNRVLSAPAIAAQDRPPLLLSPITLRGVTLRNRIMISPMCMYSAMDGIVNDFHLVHLGRYALGGAGLVVAEATAVEPRGRISLEDAGIWSDDHIEPWRRITAFLDSQGAIPGIQLAHAGRKASTRKPWAGGGPLPMSGTVAEACGWQTVAASAIPAGQNDQMPAELTVEEIGDILQAWAAAGRRAREAGFRMIEVHGAHGYLIHSFLSPISNRRTDGYGGDQAGRMRFALEIASAIRSEWPEDLPLFWRISSLDGIDGGWTLDDSVILARELEKRGVDVIDTSSGGITTDQSTYRGMRRGFAFHTPYSSHIRRETGICMATVGLIIDPIQAEGILQRGEADIIAIGREALADPNWALNASAMLGNSDFHDWPVQAGYWLSLRAPTLRRLAEAGETPRVPSHTVGISATGQADHT